MARNTSRFTRHQGFLTLWALFFLAGTSLLLSVVGVGLAARRETTNQLVHDYEASVQVIDRQRQQHVKRGRGTKPVNPVKRD